MRYHIAVLGAGPAGLSAAARAAYYDRESGVEAPSYVLLEGFSTFSKTIQTYQKGKHVMDEPGFLQYRLWKPYPAFPEYSGFDKLYLKKELVVC